MKIDVDIPDHVAKALMESDTGKIATAVAANMIESACDNLETRVVHGDLALEQWIAETRKGIARMRAELL